MSTKIRKMCQSQLQIENILQFIELVPSHSCYKAPNLKMPKIYAIIFSVKYCEIKYKIATDSYSRIFKKSLISL